MRRNLDLLLSRTCCCAPVKKLTMRASMHLFETRRLSSPAAADQSGRRFAIVWSTFGAARLLVIENSEPALYATLESLLRERVRRSLRGGLPMCAIAPASVS